MLDTPAGPPARANSLSLIRSGSWVQLRDAADQAAPDSQFVALAQAYVNFALTEPDLMREMFSGLTIHWTDYPSLHAASKSAFDVLLSLVERGQAAGTIVPADPIQLVLSTWSMIHGLAVLLLENQMLMVITDPEGISALIQHCVVSLQDGIRPR